MTPPAETTEPQPVDAPGLGASQRSVLELMKRRGGATVSEVARALDLNVETVREHVRALTLRGLVARGEASRARKGGRGRPEIVYGLTPSAERLFPRREGEVLQELATYLRETGNESLLLDFFERFIDARRADALARVRGLEGRERLDEVARILSELGFMAEVEERVDAPKLRLCHCPIRDLVDVTRAPCRMEIGFVAELMGERLTRLNYIPAGDPCCSYRAGGADA